MRIIGFLLSLIMFVGVPTSSWAHFIWIAAQNQAKDGKVHVYFSESASPDDPSLLEKITKTELWQITQDGKATVLPTTKGEDSLVADPIAGDGSVFVLNHEYGVISRGNETFLLKYHAKCQPSTKPQTWRAVANADRLPMEVAARAEGAQTEFTVLWQGKPLANSTVMVTGPGIESKLEDATNEKGEVTFGLKSTGLYSIRAKHSEAIPGELAGKAYTSVRHYATLALSINRDERGATLGVTIENNFPALDPGITSFGAAIIGDDLYMYGGHFGTPHHYSMEGQSNQLLRLNLKLPTKWEVVSTGPKRAGLTAVSHGGKFYRIGGFEARNVEADKQSLWSMDDFARFDPKSGQWEQLPSMPTGRSSHDALVIGDKLYVVGGWQLQGEGDSKWHDTAYMVDLASQPFVWNALPTPPFRRRAVSLGEWNNKVYVIGGMQSEGGPTTATAIYDPQSASWSEGPTLNGEPIEGFGSSAFLCTGKLCVSTIAGNLQILSDDGTHWINSGKLAFPRFFHRMLPLSVSQAVIVGGASMKDGKIRDLEIISIEVPSSGD